MAELSNDNLTLWLKAKDGLPCEDARALIERVGEAESERDTAEREMDAMHSQAELEKAQSCAYDEGEEAARGEYRAALRDLERELERATTHLGGLQRRIAELLKEAET